MISRFLYFALSVGCLLLASCQNKGRIFEVAGTVEGAEGDTIYLVREGIDSVVVCDSAIVGKDGSFSIKANAPAAPDFYSLRFDSVSLWLVVDSTESIVVDADAKLSRCLVKGSDKTVELHNWQQRISLLNDSIHQTASRYGADRQKLEKTVFGLVSAYKDTAGRYIQYHTASPVSYYLLFKQVAFGLRPFEANAAEDGRYFAMVANAWNKRYPASARAKQLKEMMKMSAEARKAEYYQQLTAGKPQTGFIDLAFPNANGQEIRLSSLKGKPVLLEFCYLAQMSDEVMDALKQIHSTYKKKGFEIYMVTFDRNKDVWRKQAKKLPWIVVLDERQVSALTYNFEQVPTNVFLGKGGDIVGRDVTLDEVAGYMNLQ